MEQKLQAKSNGVFWGSCIAAFTAMYGIVSIYVCKCDDVNVVAICGMVIISIYIANTIHLRVFSYLYVIGVKWERRVISDGKF